MARNDDTVLARFRVHTAGSTAVEYGLLIGIISGALIVSMTVLGNDLSGVINNLAETFAKMARS